MKSNQILIVYSFLICLLLTIVGIFSAKTTTQLFSSFIYLPLIFYFGTKLLNFRKKPVKKIIQKKNNALQNIPMADPENPQIIPGIADKDKRLFLKLIGSSSLSLLLMALFTKKAQASFFGSVPGPGVVAIKDKAGNKIDPAEKSPTDGYEIAQIDDSSTPSYFGFLHTSGAWYIMSEDALGAYRYAKGTGSFSANWADKANLEYGYFDSVFS